MQSVEGLGRRAVLAVVGPCKKSADMCKPFSRRGLIQRKMNRDAKYFNSSRNSTT